ncbi:hypothetical protein ABZV58_18295 [Nocardia sp. NPDC004654]|uniref:hypothetical protein n=1 Tax=Nocardia sp. NPDC004654 TaxID=3154776 RepID=UPI0033AB6E2F
MTENKHTVDSLLARLKRVLEEEGIEPEVTQREGQAILAARPYGEDSPLTVLVQISTRTDRPGHARPVERLIAPARAADEIASWPSLDRRASSATIRTAAD